MVLSTIGVGLFGMLLERFVIRRFYHDRLGALVATWGVSLILSEGTLLVFGPSMQSVTLPAWTFSYGSYSYGGYRLLLFVIALFVVLIAWWGLLLHSTWGAHAGDHAERRDGAGPRSGHSAH